jgi:hypothetical protein
VYAIIYNATKVLDSTKTILELPLYAGLIPKPTLLNISNIDSTNTEYVNTLTKRKDSYNSYYSINTNIKKVVTCFTSEAFIQARRSPY